MLNQEPAFAEPLGNGLERLVSQGFLFFYRKLSPLQFLPGSLRFASSNRGCRLIQLIERNAPYNTELRNFRSQIVIYCKLNKLSLITFIVCVVFCNVMGFLGPLIFHLLPHHTLPTRVGAAASEELMDPKPHQITPKDHRTDKRQLNLELLRISEYCLTGRSLKLYLSIMVKLI